jgi:hypothetical protein
LLEIVEDLPETETTEDACQLMKARPRGTPF